MAQEQNEAVMRAYLKAWETGSVARFDEVLAPDFVDSMYGATRTREMLIEMATSGDVAAERRVITIEALVSVGDSVVVRMTTHATSPATGERLVTLGMIWARLRDGMIVEGWGVHDRLGQLQQFGVVPDDTQLRAWVQERLAGRQGTAE